MRPVWYSALTTQKKETCERTLSPVRWAFAPFGFEKTSRVTGPDGLFDVQHAVQVDQYIPTANGHSLTIGNR